MTEDKPEECLFPDVVQLYVVEYKGTAVRVSQLLVFLRQLLWSLYPESVIILKIVIAPPEVTARGLWP